MDWGYVAGYFDGEGSVSQHQTARGSKTRGLFWFNTNVESLEAMRRFMGVGVIRERKHGLPKKRAFVLSVVRKADLLIVLDGMLPHLIIKRDKAESLRAFLVEHVDAERMRNFGRVASVSTEQLSTWYQAGESLADIGRRLGVGHVSVLNVFKKRGMALRSQKLATSLKQKGVQKSPETRAKMIAAQRANWASAEYRERQATIREARRQPRTAA